MLRGPYKLTVEYKYLDNTENEQQERRAENC